MITVITFLKILRVNCNNFEAFLYAIRHAIKKNSARVKVSIVDATLYMMLFLKGTKELLFYPFGIF